MDQKSNEEAKFLARKAMAQSKRAMMGVGAKMKGRREIENENSVRTLVPNKNKENNPVSSIRVQPPEGSNSKHFSGILHLYLRSSLAKHCQKRHIPQPQQNRSARTERRHNYDIPVAKEQYPIIRSRSTMRDKIDKDLKSQISMSQFARQEHQRPPSRRKHLEMLELNVNRGDDMMRRPSERKMREMEGSGLENETKRMIRRREDFMRSSFKLG